MMKLITLRSAKVAYPTGNKNFAVMQAFPGALSAEEADPYLMLDHFGPTVSSGVRATVDDYQVGWHPHRGMDILTYMCEGLGRHADSLGNREIFTSPGMQWCSVGSGIEHAEAGGTPMGVNVTGFQIWVNVPSARKMDPPRYGTHGAEELGELTLPEGVRARVLAGSLGARSGPFATVQPLQLIDYVLPPGASLLHEVPLELDNAMLYVHTGAGELAAEGAGGHPMRTHTVARLDASDASARSVRFTAGPAGASFLLMAGLRLRQPIAWHGPFVMTTDAEIRETLREMQSGSFPPVRAAWDYRRLSAFPPELRARIEADEARVVAGEAQKRV